MEVELALLLSFMPCWCQENSNGSMNHNVDTAGGKGPVMSSLQSFPTSKKKTSPSEVLYVVIPIQNESKFLLPKDVNYQPQINSFIQSLIALTRYHFHF